MKTVAICLGVGLCGALLASACGEPTTLPGLPQNPLDVNTGGDGLPSLDLIGRKLGESCSGSEPCRQFLTCTGGVCEAKGQSGDGDSCFASVECADGLVCGLDLKCTAEGEGEAGDLCTLPTDCRKDLACHIIGLVGVCSEPGGSDVSQPCATASDCLAGFLCDIATDTCAPPIQILAAATKPLACEDEPEGGGPVALFHVPRAGEEDGFYSLPFPNDARMKGGRLDLGNHPTLVHSILGYDLVQRYVDAIESEVDGFSTVGVSIFRMSREVSFSTLVAGKGPEDTMQLVDITPGSPDYGKRMPVSWSAVSGKGSGGSYVCDNWVAFRTLWARPLRQGTTYAAILRKGIAATEGGDFAPDADFGAMLGDAEPGDAALAAAWKAYAPLRAFSKDGTLSICGSSVEGACRIEGKDLLNAAVFTTASSDADIQAIRDAVEAFTAPKVSDVVLCDGSTKSPCDDGLTGDEHTRGCMGTDPRFWEIHGTFTAPIWQKGKRPYLSPDDGGALATDGSGKPQSQGTEEICFALSIPKGVPMPEAGWPVVLYGHGTGGDFRSPMGNGFAGEVSSIDVEGTKVGVAVLSFDQSMHGPRRGDTDLGPDVLFFNFANPKAAKGNVLQSVADWFRVERLARTFELPETLTGAAIKVDPANIFLTSHSQGSTSAPAFAAHSVHTRLALFSGAGGGLTLSLLAKTNPVDVPAAIGYVLGDVDASGKSRVNEYHPVLGLVQHYFESIEPLAYASSVFFEPPPGVSPKHVLHIWGFGDTYVPDSTAKSLAAAMRATQASPYEAKVGGTNAKDPPFSKTWVVDTTWVTAAVTDHAPDGDYDGHFVLFRNKDAIRQAVQFLGTALTAGDGIPTVVP